MDFVLYCASEGSVDLNGRKTTLLTAPMSGFYNVAEGEPNPGRTQMRIAYVEPPERMALVPRLFEELFKKYEATRG
jgi:aspartate aminotransferase